MQGDRGGIVASASFPNRDEIKVADNYSRYGRFTSHIEVIRRWESNMLLQGLYQSTAANPRIQCRVKRTPNPVAMCNSRSVQHHAILNYTVFARYGERVSVLDSENPGVFYPT